MNASGISPDNVAPAGVESKDAAVNEANPQPTNSSKVGFVPFRAYRDEDFDAQREISELERRVLKKIHKLDRGSAKGCYASNAMLAEYLALAHNQVRGAVQRLKKRGFLVTMGYSPIGGVAFRRVILKYERIPGVRGVGEFESRTGQLMKRRYRKAGEVNPAIRLITDAPDGGQIVGSGETQNVQTPARLDMLQTENNSDNKSPLPPCEQGGVISSSVKPGKRGNDWIRLLANYPETDEILRFFKITEITPALARSLVRRFQRGAVTPGGLLYLARWSNYLPTDDRHPARAVHSIEDFLSRYQPIKTFLIDARRDHLLVDLQCSAQEMHGIRSTPLDDMRYALEEIKRTGAQTFDAFTDQVGDRRAMWFAAYYFKSRGHDINSSPGVVTICRAAVMNPEVFDFMRQHLFFDLAPVALITKSQAVALRADIVADIQRCKEVVAAFPTLDILEQLDARLKNSDFCTYRVDDFYDTGEIESISSCLDVRLAERRVESTPPAPLCPDPATVEPVSPAQCPGAQ